jgi:hypothetical protein
MLIKGNSRLRKSISKFLGPLSKPLSQTLNTAQFISRSPRHSFRLLVNSWLAPRIQAQTDVYPFAAYLAERYDCTHVVAIGRPSAKDLMHLFPRFAIIGIVPSEDLQAYRSRYRFATWVEENTNLAETLSLPDAVLQRAIIVSDRLDHFARPESWLKNLKTRLDQAPVCIFTNMDLDRAGGNGTLTNLEHILKSEGFHLEFIGWTASDNVTYEKKTILAVTTNNAVAREVRAKAPAEFRVVAFMAAYNEEDIIVESIKKWTDQGICVHVLENWSTDATYDLVTELATHLPVSVERFPKDGPSKYFDWGAMLARMETLSRKIEADWFIRRGADEVLVSPWPGMSCKDWC